MALRNTLLAGSVGFALALGLAAAPHTTSVAPAAAPATMSDAYKVDPVHSALIFKVSHNAGTFFGRFNDLSGSFMIDPAGSASSSLDFTVKTDSIDTNNEKRNADLKGAAFFNTKQFPDSTFKSKSVKKTGEGMFEVAGDFTLNGATKPVTVKISQFKTSPANRGHEGAGFEAQFTIKRSDFGMTKYTEMIGDEIVIMVGVEGARAADTNK